MKIKIADLDLSLQTRAGTDAETINNYAEAMSDGARFPDVTVFTDGTTHWLADGFHRVMALKQLGKGTVAADVRKGTSDDAVVFGGTANNKQGKRPTRADVQHFLEMVWERREAIFGGTPTGGNMAEKCGVSRRTGETFVREKLAEMPKAPIRPTAQVAQLPTRPKRSGDGVPTAQVAQLTAPIRPEKLVGKNGKMYAVNPAPKRPEKPVGKPAGKCRFTDPDGFCTNEDMQGGGFRCVGPTCENREPVATPAASVRPKAPGRQIPVDRFGVQIPLEIGKAFGEDVLADILSLVSKARVALRKGMDDHDLRFAAVRQDALINLDNAYNFISAAEPHCVCRICQGSGCKACHNRGWQTKDEYKANPKEFQAEGGAK